MLIENSFPHFCDVNGSPLNNGSVYFGTVNKNPETNPIAVFWDVGLTQAAAQPIKTINGYFARDGKIANLYSSGSYSITVKNKSGVLCYTLPDSSEFDVISYLNTNGASSLGFMQSGTGAIQETAQDQMRREVYLENFGAKGDGVTDDLPAILKAIASFPSNQDDTYYSFGGTVKLLPGKNYYCSATLNIERQMRFIGATAPDGNALGASRLSFADNCDGIVIHDYRTSASGKDAGGTELEGICIQRTGSAGGTAGNGVWMRTRARLKNCIVYNFRQNGVRIEATSGGSPQGNANNWEIDGVRSMGNGLHGLFVDGADTNAGVATRLDCSGNGGWGIYDSSFLGNTYLGCHTASNTLGAYKADGLNAQNVLLGCYSESGQPASDFTATTLVISGLHGAGFTSTSTSWILGGGFGVRSGNLSTYSTDGKASINIGAGNTASEFIQLSRTDYGSSVWRGKSLPGRLYFDWANLGGTEFLSIYDRNYCTIANGYARDLNNMGSWEAPKLGLPLGYFGGGMLARIEGTAAPTTGAWLKGDIVYNTNPASAGYIGWVCTVAGSPGTWKTFGLIS